MALGAWALGLGQRSREVEKVAVGIGAGRSVDLGRSLGGKSSKWVQGVSRDALFAFFAVQTGQPDKAEQGRTRQIQADTGNSRRTFCN